MRLHCGCIVVALLLRCGRTVVFLRRCAVALCAVVMVTRRLVRLAAGRSRLGFSSFIGVAAEKKMRPSMIMVWKRLLCAMRIVCIVCAAPRTAVTGWEGETSLGTKRGEK
ncbi:hypothetical protein BJ875DRAFT_475670 [Amylocarpus encephaloides]|uniref:Uncharacterized protein n=1 Tax=Amylocarpus encephaloides TaxID=45428 RepID=A0A9P7Y9W3_9HELO|nr:hypothetical protein BJ875DRAFT_475670 [Amylocarpus encephaloides]